MHVAIGTQIDNPFPGLRPFEPEEDYLFFGREQQTDELLRRLRQTRFVAVVGSSGSGKSSLVRAGLVPSLYGGLMANAGSDWRVAIFRPGDRPMRNLAEALYDSARLCQEGSLRADDVTMLEAVLRSNSAGLSASFQQARLAPSEKLLLVVDQFEELLRSRSSRDESYAELSFAFVKLLLSAASDPTVRIYVALTMRSDFIGKCAEFAGLPEAVNDGQFLVPRLSRSELRRAITGPAAVANGAVAARLVVRLLNEAGDDPNQLPVLQHALMRSWEYWRKDHVPNEPLDVRHYEAIGTMRTALSKHAEEAYAELTTYEQQIAEKTFRALVETDDSGRLTRHASTLKQIAAIAAAPEADVTRVIDHFRAPDRGFIVLRPDSFLDLSHESLMLIWGRLAGWAKKEAAAAEFYRRLAKSAELHERGAESLWINPQLALGLQWREATQPTPRWAERYASGFDRALTFLDQSHQTERRRHFWRAATITGIVLLIVLALAIYAGIAKYYERHLATINASLSTQLEGLKDEQAQRSREISNLRGKQASLVKNIAGLTDGIGKREKDLGALDAERADLIKKLHFATEGRDSALSRVSSSISENGGVAGQLLKRVQDVTNSASELSAANAENRQLMQKLIELGIPMPRLNPPPLLAKVNSIQFAANAGAPNERFEVGPDPYFQELLKQNAALLAQAAQLVEANHTLADEAAALREQNEKMSALSANLRQQLVRLDGEIKTLSSVNAMRQEELTDLQNFTKQLGDLSTTLNKQHSTLDWADDKLESLGAQIGEDIQQVGNINSQLSEAIQQATTKK